MAEAIQFAHEHIKRQVEAQLRLAEAFGKKPVREYAVTEDNEEFEKKIHDLAYHKIYEIAKGGHSKKDRGQAFSAVKDEVMALFSKEELEENEKLIKKYYSKTEKSAVRELTLAEGLRLDGRKTDEIRPIWCEVAYLPSVHGSAIFYSWRNSSFGYSNSWNF